MVKLRQFIGTKVRQERENLGLTQEKLAEKAEMDYRSIGAIERGERNLTLKSLEKITDALKIPVGQLFPLGLEENKDKFEELANSRFIALLSGRDKRTIKLFEEILTDFIKWMDEGR